VYIVVANWAVQFKAAFTFPGDGYGSLRERIIRVLGAMSTEEVLPVLEKFASRDPFRKTFYRDNDGNITYADNSDFEYPLRDLANEEIRKIRAGV